MHIVINRKAGASIQHDVKPYNPAKRNIVSHIVCNIIRNDLANQVSPNPPTPITNPHKGSSVFPRGKKNQIAGSILNSKNTPKPSEISRETTPKPAVQQNQTPKSGIVSRLFTARKQSKPGFNPQIQKNEAKNTPKIKKDKIALPKKNITIKKPPDPETEEASNNEKPDPSTANESKVVSSPKSTVNKTHIDLEEIQKQSIIPEKSTASGLLIKFNDLISKEREQLILQIKASN